jgi:nucleotide-binding universal stress UspA family protein
MYSRILVALEHSPADASIIEHVRELARICRSSLVLIHVADGWVARNIQQLALRESQEMRDDRAYLDQIVGQLTGEGFIAEAVLATGDPAAEIAAAAERERCSLIAMSTHGHRFLADLWRGSVANEVRHRSLVPVLLVRARRPSAGNDVCLPKPSSADAR